MRYLVLSDIHANLEALDATLDHAAREAYDRVLVLGDLVGYGADPASVIDRVRDLDPLAIVRGNHDRAAARVDDAETFNLSARRAVTWTAEVLTPAHRAYLAALPQGPALVNSGVEICHGAPSGEDDYVFEAHDAARALQEAVRPVCFFGHTHIQVIYQWAPDGALDVSGTARSSARRLSLQPEYKYLVNPGSVGQPRDGDPRAAYALLDTDAHELVLFRVPYAIERAQAKIRAAGLPEVLAARLASGR